MLSELAPPFASSVFGNHTVFLGGEQGGDMAVLLHPYEQIPGVRPVGGGLFYGGLKGAEAMLKEQEGKREWSWSPRSLSVSYPLLIPSFLPSLFSLPHSLRRQSRPRARLKQIQVVV